MCKTLFGVWIYFCYGKEEEEEEEEEKEGERKRRFLQQVSLVNRRSLVV
jgi:hypothetical protein